MQSFQQEEISNNREIPPQIDSSQKSLERPLFSPSLANFLEYLTSGAVCYSQKQNILMVASKRSLVLYNATTLEELKKQKLGQWLYPKTCMSYSDELDTGIIGCDGGFLYSYNFFKDELKVVRNCEENVCQVEFVGSKFYAFCLNGEKKLEMANLENEDIVSYEWLEKDPNGLCYLAKSKFLLASFDNGYVKIFKMNKLFHLRGYCTMQMYGKMLVLQSFEINRKEYVITGGEDNKLKIWHLIKGKMRLLKVIHTNRKTACSAVYLENYKILAVCYGALYIDFLKMPSGELERKFDLMKCTRGQSLFLMKDKNMLGCVGPTNKFGKYAVYFIQLYAREEILELKE